MRRLAFVALALDVRKARAANANLGAQRARSRGHRRRQERRGGRPRRLNWHAQLRGQGQEEANNDHTPMPQDTGKSPSKQERRCKKRFPPYARRWLDQRIAGFAPSGPLLVTRWWP